MFDKKRIIVAGVFIFFMFMFITFAGGTPQNQAIATRNVTFIDGYNNQEISSQRVIVGEDAEVPEDPNHVAMVFSGWYLESDRDRRVTDFTNITEDVTVIARYSADRNRNGIADEEDATYTVRFVDSIDNTVLATQQVLVGMAAVSPTVRTHTGYTFVGFDRSFSNVRENITVRTVYREDNVETNRYTVSFRDGLTDEIFATVEVEEGLTVALPEVPHHEGYTFVRFEGDLDNIQSDSTITIIYAVDANGNDIADDDEIRYTVSYAVLLDGTRGEAPRHDSAFLTGTTYTVLENTFELEGAVFIGWTTDMDDAKELVTSKAMENRIDLIEESSSRTIANEDVVYYAVFAKNANGNTGDTTPDYDEAQYKLTYVIDGRDDRVSNHVKGEVVRLMDGGYLSTEEKKFIGWSTIKWPILTKKNHDDIVDIVTIEEVEFASEDITVYTVFAKVNSTTGELEYLEDQYRVTYDKGHDAATGKTEDKNVYVIGDKYTLLENGYSLDKAVFIGWAEENPGKVITSQDEEEKIQLMDMDSTYDVVEGGSKYYAVWAIDKDGDKDPDYSQTYEIEVSVENGTADASSKTVNYKENVDFTLTVENGYTLDSATIECTNGVTPTLNGNALTFTAVEDDTVCNVIPKIDNLGGGENGDEPDGIADERQSKVNMTVKDGMSGSILAEISKYVLKGQNPRPEFAFDVKDYFEYASTVGYPTDKNSIRYEYKDGKGIITLLKKISEDTYDITVTLKRKTYEIKLYRNLDGVKENDSFVSLYTFQGKPESVANTYFVNDISAKYSQYITLVEGYAYEEFDKIITCDNGAKATVSKDNTYKYHGRLRITNVTAPTTCEVYYLKDENGDKVPDKYEYDVTFETNGHDELLDKVGTIKVPSGSTIESLPNEIKISDDKLALEKWVRVDGEQEIEMTEEEIMAMPITSDTTFKAIFTVDSDDNDIADENEFVTVTYESDKMGNVELSKTSDKLLPGSTIEFPTVKIDQGYSYAWYEGDKLVTSATVKEGETSRTFTLKVTKIDYTLTFIYEKNRIQKDTNRHYGEAINAPAVGDYRDDENKYIFKGWSITGEDGTVDVSLMTVTGNMSFTAKYETRRLPKLTATASTGNWTKDDVTVTMKPSSYTTVKKYEYKVNSGEWTTISVKDNKFTATKKGSYQFRITDQNGEVAVSNLVNVKIDKTRPVITSPATGASINANGKSEVDLELGVTETESGLEKGIVYYLPGEYKTVSEFKKELAKVEEKPTVAINNGKGTVELIFDGKYTFYAVDNVGNEVEKTTVITISGIKENGITDNDKVETGLKSVNLTIYKTAYGNDAWILWQTRPYRDVLVTPKTGFTVLEVKWDVGSRTKEYFHANGNVESANEKFTLKNPSTRRSTRYTVYVKSIDNSTGEIIEETQIIYATGHILGFRY